VFFGEHEGRDCGSSRRVICLSDDISRSKARLSFRPEWELYFEERLTRRMADTLEGLAKSITYSASKTASVLSAVWCEN